MLKYVAKFIEFSRFVDDYVAIDMAKLRKFEDGLKLSIRGKMTHGAFGVQVLKINDYQGQGQGQSSQGGRDFKAPSQSG